MNNSYTKNNNLNKIYIIITRYNCKFNFIGYYSSYKETFLNEYNKKNYIKTYTH